MIKSSIFLFLGVLFLASCDIFENEQIPECLKTDGNSSPDILTCYNPVYFAHPAWHPDGEWIAAEHSDSVDTDADGSDDAWFSGIWLVHAQTGETKPLLPFGGAPDWNPGGTHLAVHAGGGIYTLEVTSLEEATIDTNSIALITDFNAASFFPTWSGDGEWIAFDTNFEDRKGANVLWKIRKDGTDLTDISIHQVGEWRFPDWTGTRIAHSRAITGSGWEIFTMNSDGSNAKQLTHDGENYFPKFSPDGKKIAYEHREEGLSSSLRAMDSDGGNKNTLSRDWSTDASWGPDGKKIVYVFTNHYYEVSGNGQLWVMDANGKNKKQLTNHK